ncbi:MAG: RNA chaperone Hfq [Acidobacteriota bacterium]|nr:RNA chaperone Hfq [Acidobacteriota bacterium]
MDAKTTPQNIQDAFLNTARRERSNVTIYLLQGAKLTGRIKSFDKFSVLLETGAQEQLIFKHAISTISHARRSGDGRNAAQGESSTQHTEETDRESAPVST